MTIKLPLKLKISTRAVSLQNVDLPSNLSKITFGLQNVLQKIQVSQTQSNWFSFQEAATYKRQGRADLHTPDMNSVK